MKLIVIISLIFCTLLSSVKAQDKVYPPSEVMQAVYFDVSPPMRDMKMIKPVKKRTDLWSIPNKIGRKEFTKFNPNDFLLQEDPVWQKQTGLHSPQNFNPIVNFEAMDNISGFYPPDTQGDVGPDKYVQVVNSTFAIYSKTGSVLFGPADLHTIWNGIPAPWNGTDDGDPVVLYDQAADRWIISQFSLPEGNYAELVAVSVTSDPTGAWYRYVYQFGNEMPDYPKFGIWPDGYYFSVNRFTGGSAWSGTSACALERAKLLTGDPTAGFIRRDMGTTTNNPWSMLPSDWDGTITPLPGEPNYFTYIDDWSSATQDYLKIWEFHIDWITPANSTFALAHTLVVAPFKSNICTATRDRCIPQPGTAVMLESLADRLMYRLQYRNFSTHRSMVTNHTVDVDNSGHAGIRWYELRNTGAGWTVYQQGTFAPDNHHRWVGSIAMNAGGHIGLGYSVSSSTVYPGIRYTGRRATDPLGEMTIPEQTVINGSGSQTGTAARWGDYSMMSVDPTDDATFWYTTEYIQTTGLASWQTRIASFLIKNDPTVTTLPATAVTNTSATLNGTVNPNGLPTDYHFEWGPTISYGNSTPITAAGSGSAAVTVDANITSLTPGTTYHNRLVAQNSSGTTYGSDVAFIPGGAIVSTNPVTAITTNSATSGGQVTSEGGSSVNARGVCWSTLPSPTILDNHTTDGAGAGAFTSALTGLISNQVYFLRAYATNGFGTFYGNEVQFQTLCSIFTLPFAEPFSGTTIPNCWSQVDHQGNGQIWQFGTITDYYTSNPNLTGSYAFLNSDGYGSSTSQNADLISPTFDLSSYTIVNLQFYHYFRYYSGETGTVSYSINNGSTWTPIQVFSTSTTNPATFSQSIPAVAGQSQVKFKWNYIGSFGWYWAIDDVTISGTNIPPLSVTPSQRNIGPMPGATTFDVATAVPWTALSNQTWCSVTTSGAGAGTLTATCTSNIGNTSRMATITVTIAGNPPANVAVTQSGLIPPTNLAGTLTLNTVQLAWNSPVNITAAPNINQGYVPVSNFQPAQEKANFSGPATIPPVQTNLSPQLDAATAVLFNNGPLVNSVGTGAAGADESVLYSPLTTYGFGAQQTAGYSLAEDFTVPAGNGWDPTKFTFYGYQSGTSTTSTITGLFFRIYTGEPAAGGSVIWGDMVTNRMTATSWATIYRTDLVGGNSDRPVMKVEAAISDLHLAPGTYWVEFQFTGSATYAGPWVSPVTITGVSNTGNAKQYTGTWADVFDNGNPQGMPFIIEGPAGQPPQGLVGYNVYRNGAFYHYNNDPDETTFEDTFLPIGAYNYMVSAKYDLTTYGYPGQFGESASIGPYQAVITQNPARVDLPGYIIGNGQDHCYSATQVINVAGNGSTFTVQPGGSVTLVAGSKISLLPGTSVLTQGYLHGYITTNGIYCGQPTNSQQSPLAIQEIEGPEKQFRIYPNPSSGKFTLELKTGKIIPHLLVRVYNMMGTEALRRNMIDSQRMDLSLDQLPVGIYIVNVMGNDYSESATIVKQ